MVKSLLFVAALATVTVAELDQFYFTSTRTKWQCPGFPFTCPPPSVCAHDSLLDKYYCCGPGSTDAVCWSGSLACNGNNNTQIDCSGYCCFKGKEQCTQRSGQINVCWASQPNPLANLTLNSVNDTFSSISSQNPAATSFVVQLAQLSGSSTTATTATNSAVSTGTATSQITIIGAAGATSSVSGAGQPAQTGATQMKSSSGLSGGAIAGIVIGVVILLILLGVIAFMFRLRRKRNVDPPPPLPQMYQPVNPDNKVRYGAPQYTQMVPEMGNHHRPPIQEWYGQPVEADATPTSTYRSQGSVQELPASHR